MLEVKFYDTVDDSLLKFAVGCSREVIQNRADMPGLSVDDLIQQTIDALKTFRT